MNFVSVFRIPYRAFKLHQTVARNVQCDQNVLFCFVIVVWRWKSDRNLVKCQFTKQFASLLCFNNFIAINHLRLKLKNRIRIMPTIQRNKCNAETIVPFSVEYVECRINWKSVGNAEHSHISDAQLYSIRKIQNTLKFWETWKPHFGSTTTNIVLQCISASWFLACSNHNIWWWRWSSLFRKKNFSLLQILLPD